MEALCRDSYVRKVIKYKRKVTTSEKNKDTTVKKKKSQKLLVSYCLKEREAGNEKQERRTEVTLLPLLHPCMLTERLASTTDISASRLCPVLRISFTLLSLSLGEKAEESLPTSEKDLPSAMNNCPEGANAYGSHCYYFVEDRLTWGEADVS